MSVLEMKYFVLKPRGDDVFAEASRRAMRAYADTIEMEDPEFASHIRLWVFEESNLAMESLEEAREK